jgi:hypothetical protein
MKKQKQIDNFEKVTILFGYGLFALFLIVLVQTLIYPWVSTLFYPKAEHFSIVIFMLSLITGAVLPTLLSYLLGDRATHSKSKLIHHFNGILFGIAAFWISLCINYFGADVITWLRSALPESWAVILHASWQIAIPVIIMGIVAFTYARHQKKKSSVIEHRPYQIVLFGSFVISAISVLANAHDPSALYFTVFLTIGIPVVLTALSYGALLNLSISKLTRLTLSVVSMSFAFIAFYITSMSLSYVMAYNDFLLYSFLASPAVMVAYLLFIRK